MMPSTRPVETLGLLAVLSSPLVLESGVTPPEVMLAKCQTPRKLAGDQVEPSVV